MKMINFNEFIYEHYFMLQMLKQNSQNNLDPSQHYINYLTRRDTLKPSKQLSI
jgi:hypothetical protein